MLYSDESISLYHLYEAPVLKSKKTLMAELETPCSRFTFNVRSIRSDFRTAQIADRFDPFSEDEMILTTNTPANWQAFLRFLKDNGITTSAKIISPPLRNGMPPMYRALLRSGKFKLDNKGHPVDAYGFGASHESREQAISKAFGEVIERYFSAHYSADALRISSYDDLKKRRFGPRPFDIFSINRFLPWQEEAFPKFKYDGTSPLAWVLGKDLDRDAPVYLPAQLVFWNYRRNEELMLYESNTNGIAGHFTRDEALLGALLELIQRDGFAIHWLKVRSPRRIDEATIVDPEIRSFVDSVKRAHVGVYFLDTTTDIGVPTCVCVLTDTRNGRFNVHLASSTGFSEEDTIRSSLVEALVVYHSQLYCKEPLILDEPYEPFRKPIRHIERLRVWRTEKMYKEFLPFLQGEIESVETFLRGVSRYDTVSSRLAFVRGRFASLGEGYGIYTYEYEDKLLKDIGFCVMRTIVPRMINLYLTENTVPLGAPRLQSVPPKLKLPLRNEINPWPHPFP